ncbi:hypothetical protein Q0601_11260 [Paracoccus onubensis]|uniref:hypothetical protein n=1 Tax=Paracoccus onubensis TaxID=1675788 RepID=UPI0027321EC0|nr:hypothetical protein [Paracoccus onubensis]MDP0927754.1 hypothetical protein [Paracoccus onubensis]
MRTDWTARQRRFKLEYQQGEFGGLNDDPRLAISHADVSPHRLQTCRPGRILLFSYMGVIRMACVTGPFHENKQHFIQV